MSKSVSGTQDALGSEPPSTVWEPVPDHLENSKTHRAMVPGGWLVRTTVYIKAANILESAMVRSAKSMRMSQHATGVSTSLSFVPDAKWQWSLDVSLEHARVSRSKAE